jgi:hypothetical protein
MHLRLFVGFVLRLPWLLTRRFLSGRPRAMPPGQSA